MANIGDIIASMIAMKKYYEVTGKKVIYCQQLNVPAFYYEGAVHPTLDGSGKQVMVNEKMFEMIKPLLLSQGYVHDVEIYNGQPINIDLDVIRKKVFVNMPNQSILQWIFMAYPDVSADISKAWIDIGEVDTSSCYLFYNELITNPVPLSEINLKNYVIVNFTERYRNHLLDYFFLKEHMDKIIFSGTENEYNIFCDKWKLQIPRLHIDNFLQLAYILKQCKFLLSNQSFQWNLAEAMKIPRILELCEFAPNCQAFVGENSFGYYHQQALKYFFNKLLKNK